jgi:site-specific recombinase XerD
MLEEFFVVSAAAERLRSCFFGAHLDGLCSSLRALGYPRLTIRAKLCSIARLGDWMTKKRLGVIDLDEPRVDDFLVVERRRGRRRRGGRVTLLHLLAYLRDAEVVPMPRPVRDDSFGTAVIARYEEHLRRERGLATSTITRYRRFVREFVAERLDDPKARAIALGADEVRAFLLKRVPRMRPKCAQLMAAALRSFLRFLFVRGETRGDLALAIPMVRQERLVSVPRHLPAEDVERLLAACDLSSITGRRDHALLLLLARLGLRAGEIIALQLGDVRWREGEIVVRGKGQVHDRLPLLPDVGEALAIYIQKDRPAGASRHVFICRKAPHRGFSHPSSVTTIVMRALGRAGLTPPTRGAHLLRHSLATTMMRRGASFAEIGQVLRHRSPNTTEIYAKVDLAALADVARPWPGAGGAR